MQVVQCCRWGMDLIINADGRVTLTKYCPNYRGIDWVPVDAPRRRNTSKSFGEYKLYRLPEPHWEKNTIPHKELDNFRKKFDFFFAVTFLNKPVYPVKVHFFGRPHSLGEYLTLLMARLLQFKRSRPEFWVVQLDFKIELWGKDACIVYEPKNDLSLCNQFVDKTIQPPPPTPESEPEPEPDLLQPTVGESLVQLLESIDNQTTDKFKTGEQQFMLDSFFEHQIPFPSDQPQLAVYEEVSKIDNGFLFPNFCFDDDDK